MSEEPHLPPRMIYLECDVPDGLTLAEWRTTRREPCLSMLERLQRRSRLRTHPATKERML